MTLRAGLRGVVGRVVSDRARGQVRRGMAMTLAKVVTAAQPPLGSACVWLVSAATSAWIHR